MFSEQSDFLSLDEHALAAFRAMELIGRLPDDTQATDAAIDAILKAGDISFAGRLLTYTTHETEAAYGERKPDSMKCQQAFDERIQKDYFAPVANVFAEPPSRFYAILYRYSEPTKSWEYFRQVLDEYPTCWATLILRISNISRSSEGTETIEVNEQALEFCPLLDEAYDFLLKHPQSDEVKSQEGIAVKKFLETYPRLKAHRTIPSPVR